MKKLNNPNKYSDDYKHFDNLIWQLPVWSTAIFLLAVTGIAYISNADFQKIAPALDKAKYSSLILFVCFMFQLAIFNALIRFRDHQTEIKTIDTKVFAKWWYSGQTWLQFAVIGQTCSLFYFAIQVSGLFKAFWPTILLGAGLLFYSLLSVNYKQRNSR